MIVPPVVLERARFCIPTNAASGGWPAIPSPYQADGPGY